MTFYFRQLTGLIELAFKQDPAATAQIVVDMLAECEARKLVMEVSIIKQAIAQLSRGQSLGVLVVDGSAEVPAPEPAQEVAEEAPTTDRTPVLPKQDRSKLRARKAKK